VQLNRIAAGLAAIALTAAIAVQPAGATHVRPKAATPFLVPLVPAYQECTTPNRVHASPLTYGACNPPVQSSPNLTVGTPDANGAAAKSVGSARFKVIGAPGGADDEDVQMTFGVTDVRCQAGVTACGSTNTVAGPDYTGELEANTPMQITDHAGGPTGEATTMLQIDFPFSMPCNATADTTVGSSCSVATTMNTQVPGAVHDSRRNTTELDGVTVWDGGQDGDILSPDNSIVFVQGVFAP
jgi:hypothetical protein